MASSILNGAINTTTANTIGGLSALAANDVVEIIVYDTFSVFGGNVNADLPVMWTGKKMSKRDAVRRFAFTRTVALAHTDGLSFDFLQGMAKELADSDQMVLIGAGKGGKQPLVLQENGSPYRAFLEGRVDGDKFALLLHLSHMELKRPAEKEED